MPILNGRTTLTTILLGSVIPPGSVTSFAGPTAPAGWLLCDGSLVSRTTYAALFAAIGTAHGSGDGSTTFQLPDYRGRFLRGVDNMGTGAAGRDPDADTRTASNAGGNTGNAVGSVQSDSMQLITGNISSTTWRNGDMGTYSGAFFRSGQGTSTGAAGPNATPAFGFDSSRSPNARTSTETRSQNAYVEYIIKV